ncbi:multiple inositol polyphosphate phosphatase 1-like [Sitodiplosis mosellana]|uniref:multiple inositol polyphosphate phosphatase 1-like n=1 Tax=Sitodiplosis mosellana TaxID=263140 RepID=UPI002443F2E8|nr:multiple inositol polyphosphate phosphatase 1-like [Sitodiplosis mosellana]
MYIFQPFIAGCLVFTLTTVVFVNGHSVDGYCHEYCYSLDHIRPQTDYFSSKTSYFVSKRQYVGKHFIIPNCSPVKIWLYIRHGARLPKAKEMKHLRQLEKLRDEILANHEKNNSTLAFSEMCRPDLKLLKEWNWDRNITEKYDEFLTEQGWNDIKTIAKRYKQLFPNIFEDTYDEEKFSFRYTDVHRTEASYRAFVEGLFGLDAHEYIHVPPHQENIKLLKPYKFCPTDEEEITGKDSEYRKYLKSKTISQLVMDVSKRLGFECPLKMRQVLSMYDMCVYEQAWNLSDSSPWCAAFTPSQFYDLEYPEDLRKYYESGHGREANSRFLCALVNDLLAHLGNDDQPKAVAYVTHSSSLLLLLTSLGVFNDSEPLRADSYHRLSDRKWRLSKIAPFASNFAAVKYDCPNDIESEKVKFFINEEPIDFEWCDAGLCDWSAVKERYKKYTEVNCDEYFCSGTSKSSVFSIFLITLATLAAISLLFNK